MQSRRLALSLVLAASPLAAVGCFLVAAGAGAAGAIAYTNRGATSVVAGPVDQVFDRSVAAFQQAGINERGAARKTVAGSGSLSVRKESTR